MATILVVDDHPDNRDLLVTLLRYHGHAMLEACDGAEGRLVAQARHPDLVITDLVMPVMDGYQLVRELRADPSLAATKVIFWTANYLHHEAQPVAKALGVHHIMPKPAEPGVLLAAVDAVLSAAAPTVALAPPEDFHKQHLRLVTAKLAEKVRDLEAVGVALRESEARFRSLTESAPVGIFSLDSAGRVTYGNPRLLEICGLSADPAAPAWTDLLRQGDKKRLLDGLTAAAESATRYGGRVQIIRPAGGLRWAEVRAAPVLDDGEQLNYVGTVEDVTEVLAAQQERDVLQARLHAQRAEGRFRGLLEAAPDAVVCVSGNGQIALVNAQAERLFGYRREELTGQPVEILVPDEVRALHPGHRASYTADPQPRPMGAEIDLAARRRDGSTFPAEISLSTIATDEGILVLAAVRDISERLALQAEREQLKSEAEHDRLKSQLHQSQQLESLGELAGGIAHDFNNLLAVISNYAAFVAKAITGGAPKEGWQSVRDDVQQIEQAAARAAGLTHQLLAFARREVIQPRALNLNEVIAGIAQMLARTLGEHMELSTDLAPGLCPVLADPGQVEQVLVNLAINARDAMPEGGKLTIQTATTDVDSEHAARRVSLLPGRYASLKVSDTGTGMPQEVIDRAFEPFFTTKPKGRGTGLGLATVYGIVTQSSGYVQVYSEPGMGTTFTILLPATSLPAREEPPPRHQPRQGGGETVLVVEDEAALREVICRILDHNGYQVIAAASGHAATEIAASHPGSIDVLVTDVVMPQMLGKEAARRIQAQRPAVKVLFMSGHTEGILSAQGILEAGVNLIEKPFSEASLLAKLRDVMAT